LVDFVVYAHRTGKPEAVREAFADIQKVIDPATRGSWHGHSLERWRSFAVESTPLDEIRSCAVPTFVADGSRDSNSPVESADTFVVELLRSDPRRGVFYWRVHEADLGFSTPGGESYTAQVLDRFLEWALSPKKGRGVIVGPPFEVAR
jgi:hypothetical protein